MLLEIKGTRRIKSYRLKIRQSSCKSDALTAELRNQRYSHWLSDLKFNLMTVIAEKRREY